MGNLLLCGPPGVGKTTCVLALARELLAGSGDARDAVLELNASDERGIDVVRSRIHAFARAKTSSAPLKLVILDEVDAMTTAAQQCLRVLMEDYAEHTKFALACNTSSKVIEAVQSRCAIFRFSKLKEAQVESRLKVICQREELSEELFTSEGLKALAFVADGDLRVAVNGLQSCACGYGKCTPDVVYKVCDQPNPVILRQALIFLLHIRPDLAFRKVNGLLSKGYATEHVLQGLGRAIKAFGESQSQVSGPFLSEGRKLEFLKLLSEVNLNAVKTGCASKIQVDALMCKMALVDAKV